MLVILRCLPLKHPENKILTEQQPKEAKFLCCFRRHYRTKGFENLRDRKVINIVSNIQILTEQQPKEAKFLCCFRRHYRTKGFENLHDRKVINIVSNINFYLCHISFPSFHHTVNSFLITTTTNVNFRER